MSAYSDLILGHAALQSYWRLGEASGASGAADSKGTVTGSYTGSGVTYGQPGLISGDANTCVLLDQSVPGDVRFGDNYDFSGTAAFSAEAWVKITSDADGGYIWFKGEASGGWIVDYATGVSRVRRCDSGGANDAALGPEIVTGNKTHVVATYDGTTLKLYVNGVVDGTVGSIASSRLVPDTAQVLCLGSAFGGSGVNGYVDEAAIYNAALTASDVLAHYQAGAGPPFVVPHRVI